MNGTAAWGAIAALVVFAAGAIFYAGKLSERVEANANRWAELRTDLLQVMRAVHRIEVRLGAEEE